ncbi:MAG TPA: peptide-binding protein, partial [Campylobacterales bacterium]|nr:peptide-binding protein [Campylobacterales bacterium]
SSLVVIPIILTGKLLKLPWVGFFSALLGSIAWSYYNRTMTGYYDTDMFSVFLQFTILYLFILTLYHKESINILYLSIGLLIYPYYYPQGLSLIYAIFILWVAYQLIFQREEKNSYLFIAIAGIALWNTPILVKILIIGAIFIALNKIEDKLDNKKLLYLSIISLFMFFIFGDVFQIIWFKIVDYTNKGVKEQGLHFYQVVQTVREAGSISWETVANRIIGGVIPLVISVIGYILLVIRHKQFLIALPLIGVGIFAHWAGLRFTVYAVPVAGISAVYFFAFIAQQTVKKESLRPILIMIGTILLIIPNITHILGYKVPTVFNKAEVQDLNKLNNIASSKDYTLTWWDYGYPIWFYSDTSTLIDGAKHNDDNFIISTIMFSTSQQQVANLSRLAVETYAKEPHPIVADTIFKDKNPNKLLNDLKKPDFKLPNKTRDIYLYMPYRMMNIFPTIGVFGNLDLKTGHRKRNIMFYPTGVSRQQGSMVQFSNGIIYDVARGVAKLGKQDVKVYHEDIVGYKPNGQSMVQTQIKHIDGNICIVFMKSYGRVIVMDKATYNSAFVQMFILDNYDKNLFEEVIS